MTMRHFDWLVAIVTAGFTPGFLIGWRTSRCESRNPTTSRAKHSAPQDVVR